MNLHKWMIKLDWHVLVAVLILQFCLQFADLKPFSSKVLKTDHGNHTMDIRIQNKVKQEKSGVDGPRQKWNWKSCPSQLTIAEYARYQAASFVCA